MEETRKLATGLKVMRLTSSLSDLGIVGCKLTAAVYFSPFSYPISRYWDAKSSKTILAVADFRFRRPKSDRLLVRIQQAAPNIFFVRAARILKCDEMCSNGTVTR